jgi:uncharacterized membrane protein YgcG
VAYNKHTWVARQGVGLNKFTDQNGVKYEFTPSPDEITQPGTPFSAAWMNDMEAGIASAGVIYGICETAAATAAKTVDTGGAPEQLANGDNFRILFVNEVQVGATLNINGIGAYPIIDNYTGEAIVLGDISAGYVGDIVFEDGRFVLLNAYRAAATPTGYQMFTANDTFVVPARVTSIRVSACAAGVSPYAGEGILNQIYNVTPGQEIPLTIGTGNTIIGDLVTLVAGALSASSPTTKLGYATGYGGGKGYSNGGYGGFFGYGGGGGGRGSGVGSYGGGGGAGDGAAGGAGSMSGAGLGGGTTGGAGGSSGQYSSDGSAGSNSKVGNMLYVGGAGSYGYNGGSGTIYGAGGGGGAYYKNTPNSVGYGGGGGAGGYGAGGGDSAAGRGAPSNGMVLIEWGFTL